MTTKDQLALGELYLEARFRNPQYYDPEGDKYQKEWEEKGVDRIDNFKTKSISSTLKQLAKEIAPRKLKIYNYFSLRDDAELWPAIPLESEIMQNFKNTIGDVSDIWDWNYGKGSIGDNIPKSVKLPPEVFLREIEKIFHENDFIIMTEKEAKTKIDKILKRREDKFNYQNPNYNDKMHYDDDGISPETYM